MPTLIFKIGDIHCIGCINRISNAIKDKGAVDVDIDLATRIAKIFIEEKNVDHIIYEKAIAQTGYHGEYLTTIDDE
ncbi:MAG: heavy metal-associated domain-containing protein [Acholeplasmataceae bacterium]|nr:heavy metal-associated domain-containing protein [Acholeplasmataceae bacterium]